MDKTLDITMSKFKKQSKKNILDSTVLEYIMQIFNQTMKKLQLAITLPILIENSVFRTLLTREEMELVKYVFSLDKTATSSCTNKVQSRPQLFLSEPEITSNLNESLIVESESSTNSEVNIFEAVVFKLLKVLYKYPKIHELTELHHMNISTQSSLFKHHLHYFLEYVISVMYLTPQEESARHMHYKKVWDRHKKALDEIKELTTTLETLRESKKKEMESVITQYKADTMIIDRLNRKCVEDLENMCNKYERKQYMSHKNWETKREELQTMLDKVKESVEALKKKNVDTTYDLDNKRVKTEAQLLALISKFDTEMDNRQTEFDELSETFEADRLEKESLQKTMRSQDSLYNFFLSKRQNDSQIYFDESAEYLAG